MIILTDAEKAFSKILHPFIIKLTKLGIEENFLNMINLSTNSQQQAYSQGKISETFLLNSGER